MENIKFTDFLEIAKTPALSMTFKEDRKSFQDGIVEPQDDFDPPNTPNGAIISTILASGDEIPCEEVNE